MRKYLKSVLLLIAVTPLIFSGCKKEHSHQVKIQQILTGANEDGNATGPFEASGAIKTSGTFVMQITPVGTDSIHCFNVLTAPEGTIILTMRCSMVTNTGEWNITGGSGLYRHLRGDGTLVMEFPPGELGRETSTGEVFFEW